MKELNIGHAIISDSIFMGLRGAVQLMKQKINDARFLRIFRVILGIGTDFVNIERIRKVLDRFGERFEKRVFSD